MPRIGEKSATPDADWPDGSALGRPISDEGETITGERDNGQLHICLTRDGQQLSYRIAAISLRILSVIRRGLGTSDIAVYVETDSFQTTDSMADSNLKVISRQQYYCNGEPEHN